MWLWVTNCPQGQLGDVDQAAFAALKYCRNRLFYFAAVIQNAFFKVTSSLERRLKDVHCVRSTSENALELLFSPMVL